MEKRNKNEFKRHETNDLQQVLLLGHTSDLLLYGVQRAIRALHKWRSSRPGVELRADTSFMKCLANAVSLRGGAIVKSGAYRFGSILWDMSAPFGFRGFSFP